MSGGGQWASGGGQWASGGGRPVRLLGTASYLPERWMPAAEISAAAGIPTEVLVERFGLTGKHIARADEHVSDMSATVAAKLLAECGVDPDEVDLVVYFGSLYKDYPVWQVAPALAHRLGARRAQTLELDYVSCGGPVALRVCADMLRAEGELRLVLAAGACKESALIDYTNPRVRFAYGFGDGAAAVLLAGGAGAGQATVLASAAVTDGTLAHAVRVPAGGSVEPASHASVRGRRHGLDAPDVAGMRARLDAVSLDNFVRVADEALHRSGLSRSALAFVCPLHLKRSMHDTLLARLGVPAERATYLHDTGHMSGVDTVLGLDRAARAGVLQAGDVVLLLAAGTGYTWAATVLRWEG